MKPTLLLLTILTFCAPMPLFAQQPTSDYAAALEQYEGYMQQSDRFYLAGDFAKSADMAGKANQVSTRLQNIGYSAHALFFQGRALGRQEGRRLALAAPILEKAYRLARLKGDSELVGAIVAQQRQVALDRGKTKDAERFQALLQQGSLPELPDARVSLSSPTENPSPELRERLREMGRELDARQRESAALAKERQVLAQTIAEQEAAIANMNESQAKARLALEYQKRIVDSLIFYNQLDSLKLAGQDALLRQKEGEVQLRNSQRDLSLAMAGIVLALSLGLFFRFLQVRTQSRVLQEKNRIILEERKRSDQLLLNILPPSIADELKLQGWAQARHYEQASVLFCDFRNFTSIAERMPPDQLIQELDRCFRAFDRIIETHRLEKIKTIGDCYMAAGGIPEEDPEHPRRIVLAAQDMLHYLQEFNTERRAVNLPLFEARIGIHTGPLVAGVVGEKKFAYDVWGDTVNVAARMESGGETGRINISASTYDLVRDAFLCTHRGKINVKHDRSVDMYFVDGTLGYAH